MTICNPLGIDIFEIVLFLVEHVPHVIATIAGVVFLVATWPTSATEAPSSTFTKGKQRKQRSSRFTAVLVLALLPIAIIAVMIGSVFACSWEDAYSRENQNYNLFSFSSLRSSLESYINTGDSDLNDILESGKHAPTFGWFETKYLVKDLLKHTLFHFDSHNEENIDEGYNKGNEWFASMLGETMTYTSGIYKTEDETLEQAQINKIDYVADAIQLQQGDDVLDIGCGWTYMTKRFTEVYGANVTAVTLSKEQWNWGKKLNADNGATILLQDAMKIQSRDDLPEDGFDKITSLEMAEHVGIRRYNEFLTIVHSLLKDDGVFYFQVAGLRRSWRYEDLVWGLFMGEHVFPGADASCPLGWVSAQLERAGFEIQRVQNMGTHYSRTLDHWLQNWVSNKEHLVSKYGAVAYRRWEVFLAWSVRVARQGSSTVFMITLTKQGQEGRRIETQAHLAPNPAEV
jgi:cyclopropane fatty-acyl-phospholipid synthase-like methyltransferase